MIFLKNYISDTFFVVFLNCFNELKDSFLIMKSVALAMLLTFFCEGFSQEYPHDFIAPLSTLLQPTTFFGEISKNQLHTGIDFSTSKKTGLPVYAIADGEIIRVKVGTFGYGKVLYLKHSNGFTSVYAHLSAFNPEIAAYVEGQQYALQKFEVELFPALHTFPVTKGTLIGYTGDSGNAKYPQLHFEIRDTQTEEVINPLFFGLGTQIVDTQAPVVNGVKVYPLSDVSVVNGVSEPFLLSLNKQPDGSYLSQPVWSNGTIGFAIEGYDTTDKSFGKLGFYEIKQSINGSITFDVIFDRFSLDETKKATQYLDYFAKQTQNKWFQKLFFASTSELTSIKTIKNKGQLHVEEGSSYEVTIVVSDFHKNKTTIRIPVSYKTYDQAHVGEKVSSGKKIDFLRDYAFEEGNLYVGWDARTFLQDVNLDVRLANDEVYLHTDEIPVYKNIDVRINVGLLDIPKEKAFIGLQTKERIQYFYTWKHENDFRIRTQTLGHYKIFVDETPPEIKSINFAKDQQFRNNDFLIFEISDDLSGIASYNGYINEQWVLFEYDYKTKRLTHQLKDQIARQGLNTLKVNVVDAVGNSAIFESSFQLN